MLDNTSFGGGIPPVGSCPSASRWARRRASALSVFRSVCWNFQAWEAVWATWQGRPTSVHRS